MVFDDKSAVCLIEASKINKDEIIDSAGGSPEFRAGLRKASVLIVPSNPAEEGIGSVFPDITPQIFKVLRENLSDKASVDAAIHDDNYVEFQHLSEDLFLPVVYVAQNILLPLVISIIGNCLVEHFKRDGGRTARSHVKGEFHFKGKNGEELSLKYDGPADTYEEVNLQQIRELGLLMDKGVGDKLNESNESK